VGSRRQALAATGSKESQEGSRKIEKCCPKDWRRAKPTT